MMDKQPQEMSFFPRRIGQRLTKDECVTVVGQVRQIDQGARTISLACNTQNNNYLKIKVKQNYDISNFKVLKFIQIRGIVLQYNLVQMDTYNDLKSNFDLQCYNQMLKLANNQFKDLFFCIKQK